MKKTKTTESITPTFEADENISPEEQIARRAHELWEQRSGEHGHDLNDWLQAEREFSEWHQKRRQAETPGNPGLASQ